MSGLQMPRQSSASSTASSSSNKALAASPELRNAGLFAPIGPKAAKKEAVPAALSPRLREQVLPNVTSDVQPAASQPAAITPTPSEAILPKDTFKVVVRFKATGNAPIMKQNFFKITASNRFQTVINFLRKELSWKAQDALFLYINASFSPSPDDTVISLYQCFATDKQLIVNYSTTAAWG